MATSYQNGVKKTNVNFRNKYQLGEEDLPVKYVKRNDPRIQASADSIYAYNNTRGYSPANIISSNDVYNSLNRLKKNNPNNNNINRQLKEIEDQRNKNFPVEPGPYGSKVTITKTKKPRFPQKDVGYDGINRSLDPELKRIAKKNKPINYLSEERYPDDPYYASNTDAFYNTSSVAKKGTNLYKVFKPSTTKVETNPNIEELKKIYPNIPQTEIDKFTKQIEEKSKSLESQYYHPDTYSEDLKESRTLLVPNKPEVPLTGEEYKKYGITPEFTRTTYSSSISETPQFAKPKYKWLPEDEPPPRTKIEEVEKIEPKKPSIVPIPDKTITPKLNLQPQPQTKPSSGKKVGFIKPRRQGGWSKQPFLMNIFPGLYTSKKQNGVREANSYTFGKEPGVGRAIGKVLTGFADDKGKGYSISPSEVMKNLAMPASLLSSCTVDKRVGYHPQRNPNARPSGKAGCRPPKNPGYMNSIRR